MTTPNDQDLRAAVVQAQRELARRCGDFYQHAQDQTNILAEALRGHGWDTSAALWYLREFHDGTAALLEPLVDAALSDRSALWARQAIGRVPSDRLFPELERIVLARLDGVDDLDYRRLAELLAHVQAWSVLHRLVLRALASAVQADPFNGEPGADLGHRQALVAQLEDPGAVRSHPRMAGMSVRQVSQPSECIVCRHGSGKRHAPSHRTINRMSGILRTAGLAPPPPPPP